MAFLRERHHPVQQTELRLSRQREATSGAIHMRWGTLKTGSSDRPKIVARCHQGTWPSWFHHGLLSFQSRCLRTRELSVGFSRPSAERVSGILRRVVLPWRRKGREVKQSSVDSHHLQQRPNLPPLMGWGDKIELSWQSRYSLCWVRFCADPS